MSKLFGGGNAPAPKPPAPMPDPESPEVLEAGRRKRNTAQGRGGRASTILGDDDERLG